MTAPAFSYTQQGRSLRGVVIVLGIYVLMWALWFWLDAAVWIVLGLAAFTLPAVYDLIKDPSAGCTLTQTHLDWHSGTRHARVALEEIDHMRLDTRLDFSVRATVMLKTGRKLRLPFEATPPHEPFETALEAQGVRVKRFHFQLIQ